jgi:endonuclease/exonuclease/phosphatase family metal-dependent hydrolase
MNTKQVIHYLDKGVLGLNVMAAVALLLSYFAPVLNPLSWPLIAVLGFAYPVLVLTNLPFIVYWPLRPKKLYGLLSGVILAIGLGIFMSYVGFGDGKALNAKPAGAIRLMQYNIRAFGLFESRSTITERNLYQFLREKSPDILTFEEYFVHTYEHGRETDTINHILKTRYDYFKAFDLTGIDSAGDAIFSRYPIINKGFIQAAKGLKNEAIFIDVKKGNVIFRVYCLHLAAVQMTDEEKGRYLQGKISLNQLQFIYKRLTDAFKRRSLQVAQIKAHIQKCPYPYIVMGDFNDTPISYSVHTLNRGMNSAFMEKGRGFLNTFYSRYPLLIDHIFLSKQFDVLNFEAVDNKLSDHKPIISDIRIK